MSFPFKKGEQTLQGLTNVDNAINSKQSNILDFQVISKILNTAKVNIELINLKRSISLSRSDHSEDHQNIQTEGEPVIHPISGPLPYDYYYYL